LALPKLKVFTVTDKPDHPGCVRLKKSADYWGWRLEVQAQGGWDRSNFAAEQRGQLEALRWAEEDYFLYLDAWDTMFAGPRGELTLTPGVVTFCGDPLLGEWQRGTTRFESEAFPEVGLDQFKYVNAGVVWGARNTMVELCYSYLDVYSSRVNQDYFNQLYAFEQSLGRNRLRVDHKAEVALNIIGVLMRQVRKNPNNRLEYLPTGATPLVVHSPGTALTDPVAPMPKWLEELVA
jgi:hypothetical protein